MVKTVWPLLFHTRVGMCDDLLEQSLLSVSPFMPREKERKIKKG
jgi:hypothetical protein